MSPRAWGILLVLSGAIFLEGIDVAMMGVALPAIQSDLGMSTASLQWVVSAYVLGYGGFMLLGGRAADLLGRRRMFLFWLTVFLLFSGLGGFADSGWMLILSRFVTGLAAAFMTPAGLSIITTSFAEGPQRNKALLVYAGIAAAGFSLGLVVGGLLTAIHWRWVFFAPVILAALILVTAARLLPREERPARTSGFDVTGAVTITGAMLLLVTTVVRAPDVDVKWTVLTGVAGLLALSVFVAVERRSSSPLVRLGILRSAPLIRANIGAIAFSGSFVGFQFMLVQYLQHLRGWSALETGLAMIAIGIDAIVAPVLTPRLVARFGNAKVIATGFTAALGAYAFFLTVGTDTAYAVMLPAMLLLGMAFALAYGPLTIAATDGIDEAEQGLAGGLFNTSFQFGSALGLAVATAVNVAVTQSESPSDLLAGYKAAFVVSVVAAFLALLTTFGGLRSARR
ncbi:MFS transporter [Streptodolium elevatio]